jgi:hypothetical protein
MFAQSDELKFLSVVGHNGDKAGASRGGGGLKNISISSQKTRKAHQYHL